MVFLRNGDTGGRPGGDPGPVTGASVGGVFRVGTLGVKVAF